MKTVDLIVIEIDAMFNSSKGRTHMQIRKQIDTCIRRDRLVRISTVHDESIVGRITRRDRRVVYVRTNDHEAAMPIHDIISIGEPT